MKRTLSLLLLASLAAPLAVGGEVFSYPPNPAGGVVTSAWFALDGSDWDTYAYETFTLSSTEAITEVRWRGGYGSGAPHGKANHFTITFFATNITGAEPLIASLPDPEGEPCLANYQVNGNAGETPAGTYGGVAMYDYRYVLPTPFVATGGVKYWIRIVAWQPGYPDWGTIRGLGGNGSHFHFNTGTKMFQWWPGDTSFALWAAWKDLGFAKAGSKGLPSLVGTGQLAPATSGTLALTNVKSSTTAFAIVGTSPLQAPFQGGTLVPTPMIVLALPTGSSGKVSMPFTLPANTPAGVDLYVQFWIADPAATLGYAASNALHGTTG